jgi:putative oxidoreductase
MNRRMSPFATVGCRAPRHMRPSVIEPFQLCSEPRHRIMPLQLDAGSLKALQRWWPMPLRLIVGYGFLADGISKISKGPESFAAILTNIGTPAPQAMALITILTEVLGGDALLLGVALPMVSVPMAIVLLVAMFTVHLPYGFLSVKLLGVTPAGARFGQPGVETDLLYLAGLAALVAGGPGPMSLPIRSHVGTAAIRP